MKFRQSSTKDNAMKRNRILHLLLFLLSSLLISGLVSAADVYVETPPDSGSYTADGNITAQNNCTVYSDKIVLFAASGSITLKPGFHAQAGSRFRAIIGNYEYLTDTTDIDADSMPDWWELVLFDGLGQGYYDDFDGDGLPDYYEYKLGSDPTNAISRISGIFYEYDAIGRIKAILRIPAD